MFKSDYMLQLKEASSGSFMGTATTRAEGSEVCREKALFVEQKSTRRAGGGGGTVES